MVLVLKRCEVSPKWVVAPITSGDEYCFKTWEEAQKYAQKCYDREHLLWKIVPCEQKNEN